MRHLLEDARVTRLSWMPFEVIETRSRCSESRHRTIPLRPLPSTSRPRARPHPAARGLETLSSPKISKNH